MDKQFINRTKELKWLNEAYEQAHQTGQLLILYGKRRVGKTELVTHFTQGKPSIYYLANETEWKEQLASAIQVFGEGFGESYLSGARLPTWREFFDYLIQRVRDRQDNEPIILVFDEFPYLAKSHQGMSSFFQYGWEKGFKNQKVLLILMGSSISMMYKHTLSQKAALYGRRTGQWLLEPFSFKESKNFYSGASFDNTFPLYAITGGIPAYAREFDGNKNLKQNIIDNVLPEGKFLNIEPELLIAEEFENQNTYLTILKAIGLGRTKFTQILQNSQLQATSLPIYLKNLIDLRLIKRETPITEPVQEKSKKGSYSLSDPFLRFYFNFIFPNKSLIVQGSYEALFNQHGEVLNQLVAKAYEDASVEFIQEVISQGILPQFEQLGRWWDNKDTEIDLVGFNKTDHAILFVETKWNTRPIGPEVLNSLKRKSQKVLWGDENRKEYFALIAKGGFTEELKEQAKREQVVLIQEDHQVAF